NHLRKLRTAPRRLDHMRQHGTSGNFAQNFFGQSGGSKTRGDDGNSFHGEASKLLSCSAAKQIQNAWTKWTSWTLWTQQKVHSVHKVHLVHQNAAAPMRMI